MIPRSAAKASGTSSGAPARGRFATLLVAALVAAFAVPASATASTATTTTLDVPSGTQYGAFTVTAHVQPAPQPVNGFIPAVTFVIDGGGGLPAPIESNGDAVTPLSLSAGLHTIVASFGPFDVWDASQSDPASVTVGIATQVGLTSSANPASTTQQVTITASVTPASVTGGTMSIVDAFDGSSIASGSIGPGATSVSVTRAFAVGDHPLTATYSGDGDYGPSDAQLTQTVEPDTTVDGWAGVLYSTFYPYKDGYRDTNAIRGSLGEPASVLIRIYAPSDALIRTIDLGARPAGAYSWTWTGRTSSGAILPAGRYKVVQRLTDASSNVKNVTSFSTVSTKKLKWTSATITLHGSDFTARSDGGSGYISKTRSAYAGGVRLYSGKAGVAVAYKFTVHGARVYGSTVKFGVLGKSPNGTTVSEGLWNRASCSPAYIGCYDLKTMGPGYAWWSMRASSGLHIDERTAYGLVAVPYTGRVRSFDVAKVRFVYRWAVLR